MSSLTFLRRVAGHGRSYIGLRTKRTIVSTSVGSSLSGGGFTRVLSGCADQDILTMLPSSALFFTQQRQTVLKFSTASSSSSFLDFSTHQKQHVRHSSSFAEAAAVIDEDDEDESPTTLFSDLPNLHPSSLHAVTKLMNHQHMTEIQYKTFEAASSGKDVLGRARTGTGKTMAFLLPAVETLLQEVKRQRHTPGKDIGILIVSPTRELAIQIHEQARILTSAHDGLTSQAIFGGSSKRVDVQRFERRLPSILVATPGRLQDHIDSTIVRGTPFSSILSSQIRVLVLDETDRLLDMGFRTEIQRIVSYLPDDRQTLLFSATIPKGVKTVIRDTVKPNYVTVDCVHDHDPASHTNAQVQQTHVIVPSNKLISGVVQRILSIMNNKNNKLVVFFPTTALVSYYTNLFTQGLGQYNIIELHSKKSQSYRTSASNRFREVNRGTMFTTDVSARGMDYPNVTHVVQIGAADSRETYIHRLGRTGRAGKKGVGILILSDMEEGFLEELDGLDVPPMDDVNIVDDNSSSSDASYEETNQLLEPILNTVRDGTNPKLVELAQDAYRSKLGYYQGKLRKLNVTSKDKLVEFVNSFAQQTGFDSQEKMPTIRLKTLNNMGLAGVRGLNVEMPRRGGSGGGGNEQRGGVYRGRRAGAASQRQRKRSGGEWGALNGTGSYDDWGSRFSDDDRPSVSDVRRRGSSYGVWDSKQQNRRRDGGGGGRFGGGGRGRW